MTKRWWSVATALITLAATARLLLPTVADPDLWGHIRFGQRTLELGLERTDPFSYLTAGVEWINHEWLSEVAFGAVFDALGGVGLILLKAGVGLATVGLVYGHIVRRGSDPLRAGLLVLPTLLLLVPGLATVRPQMFTFLFFALTILVLHRADTGSARWLWALPPILGVWINFHGGVLAGVGVCGVWGIAFAIRAVRVQGWSGAWRTLRLPLAAGLVTAAALLANPYGPGLPGFLLRTATVPRPDILEWQPLAVDSLPGLVYLAMVIFAAWTVLRAPGRLSFPLLAVLAVIAVLPLTAVRHLQLFALAVPVLIADAFAVAWKRDPQAREAKRGERWLVGGVAVVVSAVLIIGGAREARCIRIDPSRSIAFPVRAVEWLADSGVRGNAATFFSWGEYALWHLAPDIRVSMDGRRETVYPDSIYEEYLRFQNGIGAWRGVLDRPETELVLFPVGWPAYNLTDVDPEWERVYADSLAGVFVRAGWPQTDRLRATPIPRSSIDGTGLCVPMRP